MTRFVLSLVGLVLLVTSRPLIAADSSQAKPLDQAVLEFNAEWESARRQVGVPRLTVEEIVAAIRHDSDALSDSAQTIAMDIAETRTLPVGVKLSLSRRHFSNQTMSYVWHVALNIEKSSDGPKANKETIQPKLRRGGTPFERLLIRKQYLASQPRERGKELRSLEELLAKRSR